MKRLIANICLTLALLLGCSGEGFALPPCPGTYNEDWTNCEGTRVYEDGKTYTGTYMNGRPHGQGTLIHYWTRYDGIFSNGYLNGEFTITGPNGNIMLGNFRDSEVIGDIKVIEKVFPMSTLPPCPKETFRESLRNCFGEFHSQHDKSWVGEFGLNGKLHGEGMYDNPGWDSKHGIWKQGSFLGSKAQIYSLLTKQLLQEDTGKYVTYTGRTQDSDGSVTLTLMVDQNGDLTGLGDFTVTSEHLTDTGPVMFSLCASWSRRLSWNSTRPHVVAGIFGSTTIPTQFQLGWGHIYQNHEGNMGSYNTNCFGTGVSADRELTPEQEKEKFDTNLLTGRMEEIFFTVATDEYWESLRKEEEQKMVEILEEREEQSRPENLLKGRYVQYMMIKECHELSSLYIDETQIDAARSKMKIVEDYYKSASKNMDTDSIWESAAIEWNKTVGGSFAVFSAVGVFSDDLYGMCRLNLLEFDSFSLPGSRQKIPEKDF